MKGDFSRDTFSSRKHYSAVLMQQGRVQLDADWNEQRAIDRHRIETEARELIGPGGGPANNAGFEIDVSKDGKTLNIGPGDYYIDGILCQNEEPGILFGDQVDLPGQQVIEILKGNLDVGLVYLDVWERHITAIDDDHIREVALGGPDTTTRSRTVWQARVLSVKADTSNVAALQPLLEKHVDTVSKLKELKDSSPADKKKIDELRFTLSQTNNTVIEMLKVDCDSPFDDELKKANPPSTGQLLAQALPPASAESPCDLPPSAGYERLENQLYRVEIHNGTGNQGPAAFKWSRDNGSVETAVLGITTATGAEISEISVRDLGRDEALGFVNGQHVELVDDGMELNGQPGPLIPITVDRERRTITVNASSLEKPLRNISRQDAQASHYKLRRWDSQRGAQDVPSQAGEFVDLEGGIQVQFSAGHYNTGDYWLIPARTATRTIEWPENQAQPPAGINHQYSRLALVMAAKVKDERQLLVLSDCRRLFPPLTGLTGLFYLGGDGQEAGSGRPLPKPLVVGVANGDRPVAGARVRFEVQTDDPGSYDGHLEADGNTDQSVVATTDAQGEARCLWTLATDQPSQQVRASLVDGTHLHVYFNANLSAAGEAVAESIQITRVLLAGRQDLRIDSNVPVTALAEGIQVVCDDDSIIDEQTIRERPTCFLTLDMPFPQNAADQELWGDALVGFQPLILVANVDAERNGIRWRPAEATGAWLRERLFQTVKGTERILAHLTLKGNFIWDAERLEAYLDGETFGIRRRGGADIELLLPSGDGRRGGDFEMWFWLVPQTLILDSVTLDPEVTGGTQTLRGTVRITGTAPANGVSIRLESDNSGAASVPGNVRIEAGQSSATFQVNTRAVGAATTVTITATLGDTQRSVDLVVRPPVLDAVTVNPTTVVGRTAAVQGTVTLTGPAPAGGINVALSSANPNVVRVQSSVNVPAGNTSAQFPVNAEPVNSPTPVAITATVQNVHQTATLTVQPPALTQLTLNPPTVLGGATPQGAIQLHGPAPANFAVTLRSTDASVATVQNEVTVPQNNAGITFPVNTRPVPSTRQTQVVASRGGADRLAALTVQPPAPVGFVFDPQRIGSESGRTSTGTITLNGPAPDGTSVTLTGSNTNTATFPATVPVQPGATRVTVTATGRTFPGAPRSVSITASYLGGSQATTLTVEGFEREKEKGEKSEFKDNKDGGPHHPFFGFEGGGGGSPIFASDAPVEPVDESAATGHPFIQSDERPELGRKALDQPGDEE